VISFLQISPPKHYIYFSYPPYVLLASPILFFSIWPPGQ
jgi:hypothetical protein